MSLSLLAITVLVILAAGYCLYGTYIARRYRLDDDRITPAVTKNDGLDFVPTRPFYLLGQHFSAIAAAGPIAGPIIACFAFGWGPCILWIVIGVVLIGAVHDFSALVASVRHGAHSIAEIAREHLGRKAFLALVAFIWLALLYVIVAFTQITAETFAGEAEEFAGLSTTFNKGGAVAMASALYLLLALVMGLVQRFLKPPMWLVTVVFVPLTLGCVWAGTQLDSVLNLGAARWYAPILIYCFVSSMLPMWLLQQPRGYLGGFVLYLAIGVGALGILLGGFEIAQPMWTDEAKASLNPLVAFERASGLSLSGEASDPRSAGSAATLPYTAALIPFLFVTIACGACSGFHGLICGGTTSKQIAKESHCKPIAFGAMLLEGFVAVIALATVMIVAPLAQGEKPPAPGRVYGDGLAQFLTVLVTEPADALGIEVNQAALLTFAATFGAMAFSTFVFDTLDVSTRLGRYLITELHKELSGRGGGAHTHAQQQAGADEGVVLRPRHVPSGMFGAAGIVGAVLTAGVPLLMLRLADPQSYRLFWTLFGTSNQLLAALTLLGVCVWLRKMGKRTWYVAGPMVFVMAITVYALSLQAIAGVRDMADGEWLIPKGGGAKGALLNPTVMNAAVSILLLALAAYFVAQAVKVLRGLRRGVEPSAASAA